MGGKVACFAFACPGTWRQAETRVWSILPIRLSNTLKCDDNDDKDQDDGDHNQAIKAMVMILNLQENENF